MDITVLVGTTKGVFLLESGPERESWSLRGPFCDGWGINHVIGDPESGRIWAAGGGQWTGAGVWRSEDHGASWEVSQLANGGANDWIAAHPEEAAQFGMEPAPPAPFDGQVEALWSLGQAHGVLYAGAKPATLLASRDGGESWEEVSGLCAHETRESWQPGAAGLVLHTIVSDPEAAERLWVGISAAGVFATEDGGASWERRVRLSNEGGGADLASHPGHSHDPLAEEGTIGFCVHNMGRATDGTLYQQNHHGVFRSADGGRSWRDVTAGLPSTFGFPIAVHPRDPQTIWTLPLNGDSIGRYPPEASAAVWRSRDGGESWEKCQHGLPKKDCFFTVLRQAMATDRGTPAGVYFGTNSGSVFASFDEGDSWNTIAEHLPTVLCVEVLDRST
ncbi:exo-alpha-sialidase [Tropicimonas sp. TH_r6]|uniref:WD40/YVTN/BNR-like repeat-containing protein n=1 Tax=Tropicimonas sp. TH_r6 TaxID=3082085 RepID=UPI0029540C7B|nr:exo-alpha-sialidase [Tropicimonas sp. TH_r6]MDV7143052.1 exo-alpha-sialidase [Tropicimonas sp. TH_r6]